MFPEEAQSCAGERSSPNCREFCPTQNDSSNVFPEARVSAVIWVRGSSLALEPWEALKLPGLEVDDELQASMLSPSKHLSAWHYEQRRVSANVETE